MVSQAVYLSTCGIACLLTVNDPARAEDQGPALDRFMQFCLSTGPHFDKTVATSKAEEWTPLAADMAMALTPVSEPTAIHGWLVEARQNHSFEALVVFKSMVGNKPLEGCTAAVAGLDAPTLEKEIVERVGARQVGEEAGVDMMYKRLSARIDGRDNAITISLSRYPKGSDQAVISIVAEDEVEN